MRWRKWLTVYFVLVKKKGEDLFAFEAVYKVDKKCILIKVRSLNLNHIKVSKNEISYLSYQMSAYGLHLLNIFLWNLTMWYHVFVTSLQNFLCVTKHVKGKLNGNLFWHYLKLSIPCYLTIYSSPIELYNLDQKIPLQCENTRNYL